MDLSSDGENAILHNMKLSCRVHNCSTFLFNTTAVNNVWRKGEENDVHDDVKTQDQGHTLLYSLQQSKCLAEFLTVLRTSRYAC